MPRSRRRTYNLDVWSIGPIPIAAKTSGEKPQTLFQVFLTPDKIAPISDQSLDGLLERVFSGTLPSPTCWLSGVWQFERILDNAIRRSGNEFDGIIHASITEMILKAVYDLENAVMAIHPNVSRSSLAQFWTSWNVPEASS